MSSTKVIRKIEEDEEDIGFRKNAILRSLGWVESSSYPDCCWRWSKAFKGKTITSSANEAFRLESRLAEDEATGEQVSRRRGHPMTTNPPPISIDAIERRNEDKNLNDDTYESQTYEDIADLITELRKLREEAAWVSVKERMPETGDRYSAMSGWSKWLECTNVADHIEDGPLVFTAAYSSELTRWHKVGNDRCAVTHWRPLPTPPSEGV